MPLDFLASVTVATGLMLVGMLVGGALALWARAVHFLPQILPDPSSAPSAPVPHGAAAALKAPRTPEERRMRRLVSSQSLSKYRAVARGASMEDAVHLASNSQPESLDDLTPSFCSARACGVASRAPVNVDEVVSAMRADHRTRQSRNPKEVLLELQRGNGRFWMGLADRPEMSAMQRRALIIAQAPSVCVVGCADSRVPVEIVFDQGLGDIFVVRLAGNVVDRSALGSVEYAVHHLAVKVVMVLGHEGCGAVRGALSLTEEALRREPRHLRALLRGIRATLPLERLSHISDPRARDREAVVLNCGVNMNRLLQAEPIARRVKDGSLIVCGAFYEITSGIVDFFSLDKHGMVCDVDDEGAPVPHVSPAPMAHDGGAGAEQEPESDEAVSSDDPLPDTPGRGHPERKAEACYAKAA